MITKINKTHSGLELFTIPGLRIVSLFNCQSATHASLWVRNASNRTDHGEMIVMVIKRGKTLHIFHETIRGTVPPFDIYTKLLPPTYACRVPFYTRNKMV